ncbi:uncharacterized protein BXIN_0248 [Babesia sp. Xinjiang]|uniref:uncharacterized protein n=1 Tax=Babesia sp. Xinjiang TaxID=462227 RepID=UPI000A241020|nr:uncharacterized protein BXIN_0248 [Babesia sp. Xinjiang]ORM39610.1 hypothetical protein BXIN_0248 [Babesia sp. Xinjiang]
MNACVVAAGLIALIAQIPPADARLSDSNGHVPELMAKDSEEDRSSSPAACISSAAARDNVREQDGSSILPRVIPVGVDVPLISSVIGAYVCQAIVVNAIFVALALLSQRLQETLDIDTASLIMGQMAGLVTVTAGGYTAYKLSEYLLERFLVRGTISCGKNLLAVLLSRSKRSISMPLGAIAAISNATRKLDIYRRMSKALTPLMPSGNPTNEAKRAVIGLDGAKASPSQMLTGRRKEAIVIAFYCFATFMLLGGRLQSFTPSNIAHPGAFAVPSASLLAEGYNYANKRQKQIIQEIGKLYGCHTCGRSSGSGKYIADHQPPSGVVKRRLQRSSIKFLLDNHIIPLSLVRPRQYFYPQCPECSAEQAKAVHANRGNPFLIVVRFCLGPGAASSSQDFLACVLALNTCPRGGMEIVNWEICVCDAAYCILRNCVQKWLIEMRFSGLSCLAPCLDQNSTCIVSQTGSLGKPPLVLAKNEAT